MQPRWKCALTILVACLSAESSRAADVRDCVGIPDDAERLACYDAALGRVAGQAAVAPAATDRAATATGTAVVVDPVAEFGLTDAQKRAQDPERARQALPDSITGTVSSASRQPTGELVVTLESGQVWTQAEVLTKARVAPGDVVTIRKAALGSYVMVTANRVAMRVRRVR